ncbi:sigma factor-like helix-turn-helix DNA-binding protein [Rummeliibacillus stabekisii]|uniref:RNA polymerase sigma factor 70 region 4 type 2 domain-containing protein n=1 Tax=Rummeliibacillus stabekisii TaxID=241244 RepID=A0A143HCX5_9BACL|nr:sigma factor-like helix-turn-helix DNA-binding protein [Rummeliibacillus stabekisii]AMW99320.1 hypothetical protein ATY39_07495 [Rummeliibacillus stabekisii]
MEELLHEYRQTKKETVAMLDQIKEKINQINESLEGLSRRSVAKKNKLNEKKKQLENDKTIISSWISNLDYSIKWMSTGRKPGSLRGAERRAAYEREKPFDPIIMQHYFRSNQPEYPWDTRTMHESLLSVDEHQILDYVLRPLTEREREVYTLARGKCKSQYEIAEMLFITRNTVKTILRRAECKIQKALAEYKEMNM